MKVGDRVTVYRQAHEDTEVCDLGEQHQVPVYLVKRLTITEIRPEMVQALAYTHDAVGDVLYAVDAQGRGYRKRPHWDGPRASLWMRTTDMLAFDQYPRAVFSRDLYGRALPLARTVRVARRRRCA